MEKFARHLLITKSPEETIEIGKLLGRSLQAGDVVALTGELGSGKTVFAKGIAAGLGCNEIDLVTSPTYKILNQYEGCVKINHFDAYRLEGPVDFLEIGGGDLLKAGGVCVIEWAERIAEALPNNTIQVYFRIKQVSTREVELVLPEGRRDLAVVLASA